MELRKTVTSGESLRVVTEGERLSDTCRDLTNNGTARKLVDLLRFDDEKGHRRYEVHLGLLRDSRSTLSLPLQEGRKRRVRGIGCVPKK